MDVADGQTAELAEKLRTLATTDPVLARTLVAELVTTLNRATAGAFGRHLSPSARSALGLTEDANLEVLEAAWAAACGATHDPDAVTHDPDTLNDGPDALASRRDGATSGRAAAGVDGRRFEADGGGDST